MGFKKATKSAAKLRLGLVGPAGSGKTMTALRVAHGLGGRVAVVDTERGSASLYSGEHGLDFDVLELDSYEAEHFIGAIRQAEQAGYDVLIIDSLSHAWAGKGGILEFVDQAAKRSGGGSFSGWRDATPRHNQLVDAILGAKLHVICTLRSKVEHVIEQVNGRTQVRKVGLQPVQRDGLEYEFTVVGDVTQDHELIITKTRAAWLKDKIIREAGEELGQQLAAWLSDGLPSPVAPAPEPARTADATGGTGGGQPARNPVRGFWLDRVDNATTVEQLGAIGDDADEAVSTGELSTSQRKRLDLEIATRHQVIDGHRHEVAVDAVA
jgi:nucleoside-triphosphatase THEP1